MKRNGKQKCAVMIGCFCADDISVCVRATMILYRKCKSNGADLDPFLQSRAKPLRQEAAQDVKEK